MNPVYKSLSLFPPTIVSTVRAIAVKLAFFALYALQHRGQESAGIASLDGTEMNLFTSMGLVSQAIHGDDLLKLKGDKAIGHTRYSTRYFWDSVFRIIFQK